MFDEENRYDTDSTDTENNNSTLENDITQQDKEEGSFDDSFSNKPFLAENTEKREPESNSPYSEYRNRNYDDYYDPYSKKNKKESKTPLVLGLSFAGVALIGILAFAAISFGNGNVIGNGDDVAKSIISEKKGNDEIPSIASTGDDEKKDTTEKTTKHSSSGVVITDVSDIVDDVMPAIVAITSQRKVEEYENFSDFDDFYRYFYGYDGYEDQERGNSGSDTGSDDDEYEDTGAGSGIVVKQTDDELYIVTNNHVVEGADALSILFNDGKSVKGSIKSTDSTADIAIVTIPLKDIDKDTLEAIKIAKLGDSDALGVGEGVVAIGNALGYGQSVTTGVISAKNRVISVDNKQMTVLQTDAAINGGNSGGALINSAGEVIGINVAKYSSSSYSSSASIEGMGFAIPISQALDTIDNLVTKDVRDTVKDSERGSIGIVGEDVNQYASDAYGIPVGILVKSIAEGSAAEKAGIKERDVIVKFDGYSMTTLSELQQKMKYYKAGETVEIVVMRSDGGEYKEMTINVTLGKVNS